MFGEEGSRPFPIQKGLKEIPEKLKKCYKTKELNRKHESYGGFPKSFEWLMEHLLPPPKKSHLVKGCELIFPDTCFFKDGHPTMIVKMDKDYCLTCQRSRPEKKIELVNIRRDF